MLSGIGANAESAPWSAFASMPRCPIQLELSISQPIGMVLLYHDPAGDAPDDIGIRQLDSNDTRTTEKPALWYRGLKTEDLAAVGMVGSRE